MRTLTTRELLEELRVILGRYRPRRVSLVPILQEVQGKFGYLPREAMIETAEYLQIPPASIYSLATFYNQFRFTPLGRNPIRVCMGTACHMRGGQLVLEAMERELDIKVGEVTSDGEFSLDRVACIGCCMLAPVVVIGEEVSARLTPWKVEEVLAQIKQKARPDGEAS